MSGARESLQWLALIDSMNKYQDTRIRLDEASNKLIDYEHKLETANFFKAQNLENKRVYETKAADHADDYERATNNIEKNLNTLHLWGVTKDVVSRKVKEHMQTDGFKDMFGHNVKELDTNLTYDFDSAKTSADNFANMAHATRVNEQVNKVLDGMMNNIYGLREHYKHVGTAEGIEGVKDIVDIEAYIKQNQSIFKIPKYDEAGNQMYNDDGEPEYTDMDNYLAMAFKHPQHNSKTPTYGYAPTYSEKAELGVAQGNSLSDEMKVLMDLDSERVRNHIGYFSPKDYGEMPEIYQAITEDISGYKPNKGFLSEGVGYNKFLQSKELHHLYNRMGMNIDAILTTAHEKQGGAIMRNTKSNVEEDMLHNPGLYAGGFKPGRNYKTLEAYIGGKDKEGIYIKKSDIGKWYFDDQEFWDVSGYSSDDKPGQAIKKYLENNMIMAKELQDMSPIPFTPGNLNSTQFQELTKAYMDLQKGDIDIDKFNEILQGFNK